MNRKANMRKHFEFSCQRSIGGTSKSVKGIGGLAAMVAAGAFLNGFMAMGQSQTTQKTTLVSTVLTPRGFEPSALVTKGGPVRLVVYNRSGGRTNSFSLTRHEGNSPTIVVDQHATPLHRNQSQRDLTLTPGTYTLSDQDHPNWKCDISVQ